MRWKFTLAFAAAVVLTGCNVSDYYRRTPKVITVDGQRTAFVCSGAVQVSGSERGGYEVSFTDEQGFHDWRGLNKVEVDDMRAEVQRSVCNEGTGQAGKPGGNPDAELPSDYVESLRKRNACEQRFYDKKISSVDGVSVMEACKKNPDRKPY